MAGEIVQRPDSFAATRDTRRANRAVSRHRLACEVRVADVDAETDVAMAKIEGVTMVSANGMNAVARMAQAQTQLEQQVPEASGRLASIAERHVLTVGDMLGDLRHDLRRR